MPLDTVVAPKIVGGTIVGPAAYTAGGFALDLSADLASVLWVGLTPVTVGVLPSAEVEVDVDMDLAGALAHGMAVLRVMRHRYDRPSTGVVSGQPGGVTVRAALASTVLTTGSSHSHTVDHDHPSAVSASPTPGGDGVDVAALATLISTHGHAVDIAAFAGSSGAATHAHQRAVEYDHDHGATLAAADATIAEVAAGTDLSSVTWSYLAVGFGDQ